MRPTLLFRVIGLSLLLPTIARTQVTQDWLNSYPIQNGQSLYSPDITTDGSGNVFVAGNDYPSSYSLIKYSASGAVQWAVSGLAGVSTGIVGLHTDASGNVYLTCNSGSGILTRAYNPSGLQLWSTLTLYNGANPTAVATTADASGNVYIAAKAFDNYLTVKLNSAGTQQWAVSFNGNYNAEDDIQSIAVDASGNVYVTGNSYSLDTYIKKGLHGGTVEQAVTYDIVTIKYDPSGNTLWNNRYDAGYQVQDYAYGMVLDASGNVYVIGTSQLSTNVRDLIAYSTTGTQLWLDQNATTDIYYYGITIDPSGNIFTSGYTPGGSFTIDRYTPSGTHSWAYNVGGDLQSINLATDKQGNCYAAGAGNGGVDYAALELTSTGSLAWQVTYNGSADETDDATGIAIFTPPSRIGAIVYPQIDVTGNTNNGTDFTTIQYSYQPQNQLAAATPDSLQTQSSLFTNSFAATLSNYPNPFHGATTITYTLPHDSHVLLRIFDQSGNPVANLLDATANAGPHTLPFNTGRLAAGIYQYQLIATSPQGTFTQTKQMIVQ